MPKIKLNTKFSSTMGAPPPDPPLQISDYAPAGIITSRNFEKNAIDFKLFKELILTLRVLNK